ncbi:glucan endo-1,6-beta-glucosidase B [Phyllosticta citrichinensis]|uniref:glucan endo-1,6-beta-glucosidase n=1 Tax=Phyllosticta citrichinensis TaxID=1130410 RepID=A0ABR1XER7_9PEZI
MRRTLFALLNSALIVRAWLPDNAPSSASISAFANSGTSKIRGVNAGSQYILEPWMAADVWQNTLGCGDAQAERQCVETAYNGDMDAAGAAWQKHWDSWITQDDIRQMVAYGLNTIRIPVGFWMKEDLLNEYERFPRGGFNHLVKFCGWASDAGLYIIIDLHGLPGRQVANNAFTGDYQSTTGFYQSDYESGRAYEFLAWMTNQTHTNTAFRNVGTIEIANEPKREDSGDTQWLVQHFYGSAIDAIVQAEEALGVEDAGRLHIAVMDDLWGSGPSPSTALSTTQLSRLLYDDHNYQASPITAAGNTPSAALTYTCADTVGQGNRVDAQTPKIVGEWALKLDMLAGQEVATEENRKFFEQYFAAQMDMYERTRGWVYWSWKVKGSEDFGDTLQWGYLNAVVAGIVNVDLGAMLARSPC